MDHVKLGALIDVIVAVAVGRVLIFRFQKSLPVIQAQGLGGNMVKGSHLADGKIGVVHEKTSKHYTI